MGLTQVVGSWLAAISGGIPVSQSLFRGLRDSEGLIP